MWVFLYLLLIGSFMAAHADDERLTWYSFLQEEEAIISYGVPETDDVRFSIVCKVSDGTGVLSPGGNIVGVKKGERVNFTVSGPAELGRIWPSLNTRMNLTGLRRLCPLTSPLP